MSEKNLKKSIYLDHHATTPVEPRVLEKMLPYFCEIFGNPMSAQHSFGWQAKEAVEKARAQVAKLIGAQAREITFTSGATESIHLAILGAFRNAENETQKKYHLITSLVEHKCSLEVAHQLENLGHQVTYLGVNEFGQISIDDLKNAIQENTLMVSFIHANNEIGSINPVKEISEVCQSHKILFHLDSAQICGKHAIDVVQEHIDLLSLSAHKLYGPKGIGAIYMRQTQPRVRVSPYIFGGGQERGLRSGTQNVPGIVGLGEACEMSMKDLATENPRQRNLRDHMMTRISKEIEGAIFNGHPTERVCNNVSLSLESVLPDQMLMAMSEVAFSSGSACASGEDSHVLAQIRKQQLLRMPEMKDKDYFTLRFGIGRSTTLAEIDYVCDLLKAAVAKVRPISQFNL